MWRYVNKFKFLNICLREIAHIALYKFVKRNIKGYY